MAGPKKKIGEILVESGLIGESQLQIALTQQQKVQKKLGETLVELGFLREEQLAKILGQLTGIPAVDLTKMHISKEAVNMVPYATCKRYQLIPFAIKKVNNIDHLVIAFSDPMNLHAADELRFLVKLPVFRVVATLSAIDQTIRHHYPMKKETDKEKVWQEVTLAAVGNPEATVELVRDGQVDRVKFSQEEIGPDLTPTIEALAKCFSSMVKTLEKKNFLTKDEAKDLMIILLS